MLTAALLLITPWFWHTLKISVPIAILLALTSISLFFALININKKNLIIFILLFTATLIVQVKYTKVQDLAYFTEDQKRVQREYLNAYPPIYWIPLAHWLEGRPETVAFYRIKNNLGEALDVNQYFFATHPRARVGINEFHKFHFIFLPFFVLGLVYISKKAESRTIYLPALVVGLALTAYISDSSSLGAIFAFPLILSAITLGIKNIK